MIKIDKSYTIKFSYAGVQQFAEFRESNGVLVRPTLHVSWTKVNEIPDITKMTNINEVLEAIKFFAYCNRAEIYLINHAPVFYNKKTKTKKLVELMSETYDKFIDQQLTDFFNAELLPIIKKNKWYIGRSHIGVYIIITKDKNGEWENVGRTTEANRKKEYEFEYLCAKALMSLGLIDSIDIKKDYLFESDKLLPRINGLLECGYYIDN